MAREPPFGVYDGTGGWGADEGVGTDGGEGSAGVVRRGGVKGVELLGVFWEMIQRDRAIFGARTWRCRHSWSS